jgi:hypothetical protein
LATADLARLTTRRGEYSGRGDFISGKFICSNPQDE